MINRNDIKFKQLTVNETEERPLLFGAHLFMTMQYFKVYMVLAVSFEGKTAIVMNTGRASREIITSKVMMSMSFYQM